MNTKQKLKQLTTSSVGLTKMRASDRVNLKTLRKMEKAFRSLLKPGGKENLKKEQH